MCLQSGPPILKDSGILFFDCRILGYPDGSGSIPFDWERLFRCTALDRRNTLAITLLAAAAGFNVSATAIWWAACIDFPGIIPGHSPDS